MSDEALAKSEGAKDAKNGNYFKNCNCFWVRGNDNSGFTQRAQSRREQLFELGASATATAIGGSQLLWQQQLTQKAGAVLCASASSA